MTARQLLSLSWRESRFSRGKLFLFLSAISLGVAALVAVQGFASNMQREVRGQARAMLGADIGLSSRQPFGESTEAVLDSLSDAGVPVARVTSFASMALHEESGSTRLVQVRAADAGFPFYGEIETEPEGRWASLHEGRNVVVDPGLVVALDAAVGDSIAIGATRFRITAILRKLPGDIEIASSFAPRVFLPARWVAETELLGFGARVEYEAFLRIPDAGVAERFVDDHREIFRPERVRARTLADQQERMEEALGRLSDFLGLIGVFALLLGGIGVASAMGGYMARKAESVAVLRCLGATARQVFGIYLIQAAGMGLVGALVGIALGTGVQWILPRLLEGLLPLDVQIRPDGVAIATGLLVGFWAAVAFALLPLLQVRSVPPLRALRRNLERTHVPFDRVRLGAWAILGGSVLLLVVQQAGEVDVGFGVALGVALTLSMLLLAARGGMWLVRRIPKQALTYTLRQGLANLHRPGNQTPTVVLALGFGAFLIVTLLLTQTNILRPLQIDSESRGNLLFFDVQEDQVAPLEGMLAVRELPLVQSVPIVPMRITSVDGVPVLPPAPGSAAEELEGADRAEGEEEDGRPGGWAVRREYRSTFRDSVASTERLVAGRWWGGAGDMEDAYEVSLDREVAEELGIGIGGRIEWDVQGIRVPTVVTSLREIDWARLEPNFFAVFEPAALQDTPQTWVLIARADSASDRATVQRDVVTRFPNVSAIDLTLVQRALDDVIGRVALVIRFLAAFSVATGFVVLLGAIATGRIQRIRESVLLKTLGATRRQIAAILFTEYAALGVLASVVGGVLAIGAGWALAGGVFDVEFAIEPLPFLGLAGAIALLSAMIGMSASLDVFRTTPMEAIRDE